MRVHLCICAVVCVRVCVCVCVRAVSTGAADSMEVVTVVGDTSSIRVTEGQQWQIMASKVLEALR